MGELAKNLGDSQRRSKKDRSTQKTAFRDVLGVLDGQGVSEVKVKVCVCVCVCVSPAFAYVEMLSLDDSPAKLRPFPIPDGLD